MSAAIIEKDDEMWVISTCLYLLIVKIVQIRAAYLLSKDKDNANLRICKKNNVFRKVRLTKDAKSVSLQ